MQKKISIFINQIGYSFKDSKTAYIAFDALGTDTFEVCKSSSCQVVFTGKITSNKNVDSAIGQPIYTADFSRFEEPGQYFVQVGSSRSYNFQIGNNLYNPLFCSALQYYTASRCGHGVCHTSKAEIYGSKKTKNVQGGWHDAGDFGRYIVTAAKTVVDLLLAYKYSKEKFRDFDILSEVRYELEWMLKMQRPDGAVYHKVSCYNFCGFIMPCEEKEVQVLAPVSIAATADFAASLAFASEYYRASDSDFAEKLLNAAEKAQIYLNNHEDESFINPPEITTGCYGDKYLADERYFALCSLWAATGNKDYLNAAIKIRTQAKNESSKLEDPICHGWHEDFGWGMVAGYGTQILLNNADKIENPEFLKSLKDDVLYEAELRLEVAKNSAFDVALQYFCWGSNGAICNQAHLLLMAYDISGRSEFLEAAKNQLNYICGANPMNYCYITGFGRRYPKHPHHRASGASGKVLPGMMVGGPAQGLHDETARQKLQNQAPAKCYLDKEASYSTNEVAIYWNSTLIYLLSRVAL